MLEKLAISFNAKNEGSNRFYDWKNDRFSEVIEKIIHFTGMTIEVIGEWIWCTNSFQYKEQLTTARIKSYIVGTIHLIN